MNKWALIGINYVGFHNEYGITGWHCLDMVHLLIVELLWLIRFTSY